MLTRSRHLHSNLSTTRKNKVPLATVAYIAGMIGFAKKRSTRRTNDYQSLERIGYLPKNYCSSTPFTWDYLMHLTLEQTQDVIRFNFQFPFLGFYDELEPILALFSGS